MLCGGNNFVIYLWFKLLASYWRADEFLQSNSSPTAKHAMYKRMGRMRTRWECFWYICHWVWFSCLTFVWDWLQILTFESNIWVRVTSSTFEFHYWVWVLEWFLSLSCRFHFWVWLEFISKLDFWVWLASLTSEFDVWVCRPIDFEFE
jgi:hypothetical protein